MKCTLLAAPLALAALLAVPTQAQTADPMALAAAQEDRTERVVQQFWDWAEVGYLETQSSGLLMQELQSDGFRIESGVVGIPTAFVGE